jgi:hypothetical protein
VLLGFGLLASGLGILGAAGLLQLSKKVIDLDELRILVAQDVADAAGVRATVWKVLDWFASYIFEPLFCGQSISITGFGI